MRAKKCTLCNQNFICESDSEHSTCWCYRYPHINKVTEDQDCLCATCLQNKIIRSINAFVEAYKKGESPNLAQQNYYSQTELIEGIDYYIENKNWVFTEWFHLKRGHCCGNGCRHCPYNG
ncbi:MAG: cysteine-rich CWC family protein [Cyclobacteriaceae bacterium]